MIYITYTTARVSTQYHYCSMI